MVTSTPREQKGRTLELVDVFLESHVEGQLLVDRNCRNGKRTPRPTRRECCPNAISLSSFAFGSPCKIDCALASAVDPRARNARRRRSSSPSPVTHIHQTRSASATRMQGSGARRSAEHRPSSLRRHFVCFAEFSRLPRIHRFARARNCASQRVIDGLTGLRPDCTAVSDTMSRFFSLSFLWHHPRRLLTCLRRPRRQNVTASASSTLQRRRVLSTSTCVSIQHGRVHPVLTPHVMVARINTEPLNQLRGHAATVKPCPLPHRWHPADAS